MIHRPVVTKLWINGRASEDRDEWTEEVRAHCQKCEDDKTETSEVQAERIRHQRSCVVTAWSLFTGAGYTDHRGQGSPCSREKNDEEQGQHTRRLPGDGDAAVFADGDSGQGGKKLVRQTVQRGNAGLPRRRGRFFVLCFSQASTPSLNSGSTARRTGAD